MWYAVVVFPKLMRSHSVSSSTQNPSLPRKDKTPLAYLEWSALMYGLGVKQTAIHKGKYIPPSLGPIEEKSMVSLFTGANYGLEHLNDLNLKGMNSMEEDDTN